jgi:hypothetical protein
VRSMASLFIIDFARQFSPSSRRMQCAAVGPDGSETSSFARQPLAIPLFSRAFVVTSVNGFQQDLLC